MGTSETLAVAKAIGRVIARRTAAEAPAFARMPYLAREAKMDEMAAAVAEDLIEEAAAAIAALDGHRNGLGVAA